MDGGFTDSLPIFPVGRTITVSPFSGSQDVCPPHVGRRKLNLRLANMSVTVSILYRFLQSTLASASGKRVVLPLDDVYDLHVKKEGNVSVKRKSPLRFCLLFRRKLLWWSIFSYMSDKILFVH